MFFFATGTEPRCAVKAKFFFLGWGSLDMFLDVLFRFYCLFLKMCAVFLSNNFS